MINMRQSVYEFHVKMNLPKAAAPLVQPPEVGLLRARLITEEFGELCEAVEERSLIATADSCADLLYVVYGTAVSYGVRLDTPYSRFNGGKYEVPLIGKLFADILIVGQHVARTVSTIHTMYADHSGLDHALTIELSLLVDAIVRLCEGFNIPIHEIFGEVHRSNMTKEPLDKHNKGGKGPSYRPPDIKGILNQYAGGLK